MSKIIIMAPTIYQKNLYDFISEKEFKKIKKFSKGKKTPFLIINPKKIAEKYDELTTHLPYAKVFYAVKANPNNEVIKILAQKGSSFDIASIYEMDQLFALGIKPDKMSFGNTIKKEEVIAYAYKKGIRLFVTDSEPDLQKIAKAAKGSNVFFRILTEGSGADWPLSRKFGSHTDMTIQLILKAKKLGLIPYGISFHVGSQQRDIGQWDNAISQCKYIFHVVKKEGIDLKAINLGGGFPANYLQPTQSIETYTTEITKFLHNHFGEILPEVLIEPGRSIAADSGLIVSEFVLVSKKATTTQYKWAYLDIGKFGGLIESIDESIKYPIFVEPQENHKKLREFILAGPTCDSMDILYEDFKYTFPSNIQEKERLYILTAGAYTRSYSSIYFNGFPPLQEYLLEY